MQTGCRLSRALRRRPAPPEQVLSQQDLSLLPVNLTPRGPFDLLARPASHSTERTGSHGDQPDNRLHRTPRGRD